MESKKPDFIAKSVTELSDEKSRWTDIGVAFKNEKSKTISILLNALPVNGKIILSKPLPPKQKEDF